MSIPNITNNPLFDLSVARTYLGELALMCAKAAASPDPREIWLAIGVAENRCGGRGRRAQEVYTLKCSSCQRQVELSTQPPFRCPICSAVLKIEWGQA
jgi:DNA-directed RNA polymerase subunit RPC12/RpoP